MLRQQRRLHTDPGLYEPTLRWRRSACLGEFLGNITGRERRGTAEAEVVIPGCSCEYYHSSISDDTGHDRAMNKIDTACGKSGVRAFPHMAYCAVILRDHRLSLPHLHVVPAPVGIRAVDLHLLCLLSVRSPGALREDLAEWVM